MKYSKILFPVLTIAALALTALAVAAQGGKAWTNSLGMMFVQVPGTPVLFCIWETRVQDYQVFASATGRSWKKPPFIQGPTHPAVSVNWQDANAFCEWLTQKERQEGRLAAGQYYRMPTDAEWSVAVGLGNETGSSPEQKNWKIIDVYPWGNQFPPRRGTGNFAPFLNVDSFENTAPVGSFAANKFGLYDLGGNVWEMCIDNYEAEQEYRVSRESRGDAPRQRISRYDDEDDKRRCVLRGGSWCNTIPHELMSSFRLLSVPHPWEYISGFRCVLASVRKKEPPPVPLARSAEGKSVDLGGGVAMEFVFIRSGSFMMGESHQRHQVTLTKPFYMGKYEVTQEQWQAVMGSNPSKNKGARNPVENVSWDDCQKFLAKLNEKLPGQKASLPTEAQWEYACRAGSAATYCYGYGESSLAEYAWYLANSGGSTHPVGTKKPNAWGLYDMHGNVWEWCNDWYGEDFTSEQVDPLGPGHGSGRVLRGEAFNCGPASVTSSERDRFTPDGGFNRCGFRVVSVASESSR